MKKIFLSIAILLSITSTSQTLDTVSVSLTLRSQDWAWGIGKYGAGHDSIGRARIRAIRAAIITANPATWTTNVTLTVPGSVVMFIYNSFIEAPFLEVFQMGTTTAERTTIYTNIRAINNSALQYFIGVADSRFPTLYINYRNIGKNIVMDN